MTGNCAEGEGEGQLPIFQFIYSFGSKYRRTKSFGQNDHNMVFHSCNIEILGKSMFGAFSLAFISLDILQ